MGAGSPGTQCSLCVSVCVQIAWAAPAPNHCSPPSTALSTGDKPTIANEAEARALMKQVEKVRGLPVRHCCSFCGLAAGVLSVQVCLQTTCQSYKGLPGQALLA